MIAINNVVGNPPYNGPGQGRPPIYHTITELQATEVAPDNFAWIVQYNWITQLSPVGAVMRRNLLDMGVFRIEDNRFDGFVEATVRTCTIYCRRGHTGTIELVDRINNQTITITPDEFLSLAQSPCYSQAERDLLFKLKSLSVDNLGFPEVWTAQGTRVPTKGIYPNYAISATYFADFVRGGIGKIQAIGPDRPLPGSQRIFKKYNNLKDRITADLILERMNSYWGSNLVKFVLSRTLTSRTLDNPQIAAVPVVPMDRIWDDAQLAQYFNLTPAEIDIVNRPRVRTELTYSPSKIITESITQIALLESQDRAVFRTGDRKDKNGEVFTPTPLVLHMMTQLADTAWESGQTFIDPTCGNGQILATVAIIKRELGHKDYLKTIYGIDLMPDNVIECRERLLAVAGDTVENRKIIEQNIVQGNAMLPESYYNFNNHVKLIKEE
jgi:N-6 DNA Methylase